MSIKKKVYFTSMILIFIVGTYLVFDILGKNQTSYYNIDDSSQNQKQNETSTIKLKIMMADTFLKDTSKKDSVYTRLDEFKNEHKDIQNIDIDIVPWDQILTKYVIAFATGESPDIVMLQDYSVRTNILNNRLSSISEYIPKEVIEDWQPQCRNAVSLGKKVFGYVGNANINVMYYNKDIFRKAGLNSNITPKTWNELVDFSIKTNHIVSPEQYGFGFVGAKTILSPLMWSNLVLQQGGNITEDQGKAVFDNQQSITAAQFTTDLINKYKVTPKGILASDGSVLVRDFMNGKYAMVLGQSSQYADMKNQSNFDVNNVGWFKIPSFENGSHLTTSTFWTFCISSQTKNLDLAFKLLSSVVNEETLKADIQIDMNIPIRKSWVNLTFAKENNMMNSWTDYFNTESSLSTNINFSIELLNTLNDSLQKIWDGSNCKETLISGVGQFNDRYYYDTYNYKITK